MDDAFVLAAANSCTSCNDLCGAEYPDDTWNLYTQLEPATTTGTFANTIRCTHSPTLSLITSLLTTALNATQPSDALGIFKPNAVRLDPNPTLFSDADEELIIVVCKGSVLLLLIAQYSDVLFFVCSFHRQILSVQRIFVKFGF
jgi:hypothetical protein